MVRFLALPALPLLRSFGKLFIEYWIALILVHVVLVKDYLELLLRESIKLKTGLIWMLQELCANNLWKTALEKAQNESSDMFNYKERGNSPKTNETPRHDIVKRNSSQKTSEKLEIYMCQSCRNINKSYINYRYFKLKTPIKVGATISTNEIFRKDASCSPSLTNRNTTIAPPLMFQNESCINSVVDLQRQKESSETFEKQALFRSTSKQDFLNRQNAFSRSPECRNSCTPFLNRASPEFDKISAEENKGTQTESEVIPKEIDRNSSPKSQLYIDPTLETPICDFNTLHRRSRLQFMFSRDNPFPESSPEEDSFFRKNWNKWNLSNKFSNTHDKRRNSVAHIPLASTINDRRSTLSKEEIVSIRTAEGNRNPALMKEGFSPEVLNTCCSSMLSKLKSIFYRDPNVESSVSYHRF